MQISTEKKFLNRDLILHLFRKNHKFWSFLGHPGRQMEGPKRSKISYRKDNNPQKRKIALVEYFSWETRCRHPFNRVLHFIDVF